ncbi:cytochrome P450 [Streptomyces sp. GC420]|uniref:cytochrome P450 n=1 Tax=Streptomyces sp. GC420 TaxID=2697568 RepID=UPI0014151650|nr:cytochrome P450 [Streptomyces sp. GC420]NBM20555.1 cytochrome P450 [Streptomyces sp. GC420]
MGGVTDVAGVTDAAEEAVTVGAAGVVDMAADVRAGAGGTGRGILAVFCREWAGAGSLATDAARQGWEVRVVDTPVEDRSRCVDAVADFLASPQSPDRAVLLGVGEAGPAVFEIADRHPERATAVVALDAEVRPPTDGDFPELPCPTLVLPPGDPADTHQAALAAVGPFLAGLGVPSRAPGGCPVRPPALTPLLLHEPEPMRQLSEAGPVYRLSAPGTTPTWIVTGHRAARTVLADPRMRGDAEMTAGFRLQPAELAAAHLGDADTITIDAREHDRLRRLVERHLTPGRVHALRARVQHLTDALLDRVPSGGEEVDLVRSFATPLPVAVLCELFGIPESDRGYIHDWLVRRIPSPPPRVHGDIDEYLRGLVAARRERPTDDFLGWVCAAEDDGLVEEDLVPAARLLMVSGCRPTTTLLANGIAALLRHRDQWQRLVDVPGAAAHATEELLRYVTPYPVGIPRRASGPVDVCGVRVPAGHLVAASLVAANRDPSVFTAPDELDIGRTGGRHAAFGHGHHRCLGAALARTETEIAIGTLARRFPGTRLAPGVRDLNYRKNRVRYLLELPVVLGRDHRP